MLNIAINGFGRIGRNTLRNIFLRDAFDQLQVVAINDLADTKTLAHLFKYDSVHGPFSGTVTHDEHHIIVNGHSILVTNERDPALLPWKSLDIDVVVESTGHFTNREKATLHLAAGAKKVIISAPPTDKDIATVVLGINDNAVDLSASILSNASCTTNNVAPMVKILDDNWGIKDGYITTVHSMTGDQNLHDPAQGRLPVLPMRLVCPRAAKDQVLRQHGRSEALRATDPKFVSTRSSIR